jgi:hypothetical protein
MNELRRAAGYWVAHGRSLARLEEHRELIHMLTRGAAQAREQGKAELAAELERYAAHYGQGLGVLEGIAVSAKAHAEALMNELEHPGAMLARRLVAAFRGARAAWRGAR